jgi:hypothetical protein
MNRIASCLFLVLVASAGCIAQPADVSGTWIPVKLQWQSAPPSIDRHLKSSQTEVLYFAKDGRFADIHCTIYQRNTDLTVSQGDPQGVYLGNWQSVGAEVTVKYRLAFRTIETTGKQSQEDQRDASLKFPDDRTVIFQGKVFRREPRLLVSTEEDLHGIRLPDIQPQEKKQ